MVFWRKNAEETRSDAEWRDLNERNLNQERRIRAIEMDMDDLWTRVQRTQARQASRARRELEKTKEEVNNTVDDVQEINKAIMDGTYDATTPR